MAIRLNAKEVISCFIDGDHLRIGLDKGRTRTQIMKMCGDKNCDEDSYAAYKRRHQMGPIFQQAKKILDRDGFTLDSMKIKGKPTIYFIVTPGSEERALFHNKVVKRAKVSNEKVRVSRLTVTQELARLPQDSKTKPVLLKALSQRV